MRTANLYTENVCIGDVIVRSGQRMTVTDVLYGDENDTHPTIVCGTMHFVADAYMVIMPMPIPA